MQNILRICSNKDPITLDPQKSGEPVSSALIFLLFKGLTRFESDHKVRCDLAHSFHASEDWKKYTFFLGEHYWSDGHLITAHDFVYSWKRALSPGFPLRAANLFSYFKNADKARLGKISPNKVGITAVDDFTLTVELQFSCPYFLELTSFCPLFPISPRAKEEEVFSISSGPFQLERWHRGEEMLFRKNPSCANLSPVHLDGIHLKVIPDAKTAFTLFENNQLDWIGDPLCPLPTSYLPALLEVKRIKPIAGFTSCWFNCLNSHFRNVHLRRAFGLTLPREKLIEKLLLPNTLLAKRFFPSVIVDPDASSIFSSLPGEAADCFEKALRELHIKRLKLTLAYEATDEFDRLANFLKSHWEATFKVTIELHPLSFKELWQAFPTRYFDMTLLCIAAQYTDILNFLERFEFRSAWRNFSRWENRQYQALLQRYRQTSKPKERQELANKAESLLLNEMPIAPIYYYHTIYLQKSHMRNLAVSPIGIMQFDTVILQQQQNIRQLDLSYLRR